MRDSRRPFAWRLPVYVDRSIRVCAFASYRCRGNSRAYATLPGQHRRRDAAVTDRMPVPCCPRGVRRIHGLVPRPIRSAQDAHDCRSPECDSLLQGFQAKYSRGSIRYCRKRVKHKTHRADSQCAALLCVSRLHTPSPYCDIFDSPENQIFDNEPKQNHR